MCSYYLVDYENVGGAGFEGAGELSTEDEVLIFYTSNARRIDLDILMACNRAKVIAIKVPVGKQSTDMHIGTYLGSLIGTCEGNANEYIVLSKDTDYDGIIQFWTGKNSRVYRREYISDDGNRNKNVKRSVVKTEHVGLNCEIQQSLSKAGYSGEIINYVASLSVKNHDIKNGKQQTYRAIIAKYGQVKGLKIYTVIKKMI